MRNVLMLVVVVCATIVGSHPSHAQQLLESYVAILSERDHFNSNGQRLTTAAAIIAQDRANFHRFGLRDPADEDDKFFADEYNRAALDRMLEHGRAEPGVISRIVNGTPLVRVQVWKGNAGPFVVVTLVELPTIGGGSSEQVNASPPSASSQGQTPPTSLLPALVETRIALVVGNSGYRNVSRLDNPANDARLMADALRSLGFKLIDGGPQIDLDKAELDRAVQNFGRGLQGADVGLFYYAGHGVQVRGANYLVPVDANPTREADVDFQMTDIARVMRQMEASGTKLNLVILDACRNNPFAGRGLRATTGGLAQMQAPEGTLISYATQPGNVAQDGAGDNSPYTKALAETIRRPGLDVFQTFNEVGLTVKRVTGGSQQPWVSSSPIAGNFYFAGTTAHPSVNEIQTGH